MLDLDYFPIVRVYFLNTLREFNRIKKKNAETWDTLIDIAGAALVSHNVWQVVALLKPHVVQVFILNLSQAMRYHHNLKNFIIFHLENLIFYLSLSLSLTTLE